MTSASFNGSGNKHEHQIPQVDPETTWQGFITGRQMSLSGLHADSTPELAVSEEEHEQSTMLQNIRPFSNILRKIEKRFAIAGDIAAKTLPELHDLAPEQQLNAMTLAAIALQQEYEQRRDLNSLNSAIKMTDKICYLLPSVSPTAKLAQRIHRLIKQQLQLLSTLHHA